MTGSLDRLIAAERDDPPRPSSAHAKKNWQRLQRSVVAGSVAPFDLPPSAVAPGATGTAWIGAPAKLLLATVLIVGGAATAVVATGRPASRGDDRATRDAAGAAPSPHAAVAARDDAATEPPTQAATLTAPVDETSAARPIAAPAPDDPQASAKGQRVPSATQRPKIGSPAAPASPQPSTPLGLARELELIKSATAAIRRSAHAKALDLLATHAREFPSGALSEDRQALLAIALCGARRFAAGARAAASFAAEFPRSVHTERVASACTEQEQGEKPVDEDSEHDGKK